MEACGSEPKPASAGSSMGASSTTSRKTALPTAVRGLLLEIPTAACGLAPPRRRLQVDGRPHPGAAVRRPRAARRSMVDGARSRQTLCGSPRSTACSRSKNGRCDAIHHRRRPGVEPHAGGHARRSDGVLWIGTTSGVTTYDKGVFTSQTFGPSDAFVRREHDHLRSRRQHLDWIADRRSRHALRRGQFTSYAARDGLPADYVATVIEDSQGTILDRHECGSRRTPRRALSADLARQRPAADGWSRRWSKIGSTICGWPPKSASSDRGTLSTVARRACDPHFVKMTDAVRQGVVRRSRRHAVDWHTISTGSSRIAMACSRSTRPQEGFPATPFVQYSRIATDPSGLARGRRVGPLQGRDVHHLHREGRPGDPGVQALFMDRDNTLWIGTRQGLNRFKDGKFTTYTVNDGLYLELRATTSPKTTSATCG